jgi:hypothetical protein
MTDKPRQAEQIPLGADGNPLPKNAGGLYIDPGTRRAHPTNHPTACADCWVAAVSGEGMSKNALKKFCKAQEKAAAAAAKAAAKVVISTAEGKSKATDEELDPTKYRENRIAAMEKMNANGQTPYPHKFLVRCKVPLGSRQLAVAHSNPRSCRSIRLSPSSLPTLTTMASTEMWRRARLRQTVLPSRWPAASGQSVITASSALSICTPRARNCR